MSDRRNVLVRSLRSAVRCCRSLSFVAIVVCLRSFVVIVHSSSLSFAVAVAVCVAYSDGRAATVRKGRYSQSGRRVSAWRVVVVRSVR